EGKRRDRLQAYSIGLTLGCLHSNSAGDQSRSGRAPSRRDGSWSCPGLATSVLLGREMPMRRILCAAGLLDGLGLGAVFFSGGCGGSPTTGTRGELSGELKEQSAAHGKRMQEFYAAKKAAKKGKAR